MGPGDKEKLKLAGSRLSVLLKIAHTCAMAPPPPL